MTIASLPTQQRVTRSVVRAEVQRALDKGWGTRPGEAPVLALRAEPSDDLREDFTLHTAGGPVGVKVRPAVSSLAVLDVLHEREPGSWLVIITDRSDDDLGASILAHFITARVVGIDPWQSVWALFGATSMDRRLAHVPHDRQVAQGLVELSVRPDPQTADLQPWPAAPGGLLTRDHAMAAVARRWLALPEGTIDGLAVLAWTVRADAVRLVLGLREAGGHELADAVLAWLAERTGAAAPLVLDHLRESRPGELVPLGLVAGLLRRVAQNSGAHDQSATARAVLQRLALQHGTGLQSGVAAEAIGQHSVTVVHDLLSVPAQWPLAVRLVTAADAVLREVDGLTISGHSELLPSGLDARLDAFARALARGDDAELAWSTVAQHQLVVHAPATASDPRVHAAHAALRLQRWLATDDSRPSSLPALARRQLADDSWVDSALHDATEGVADDQLALAIGEVVTRARARRAEHDTQFAEKLAIACQQDEGVHRPFPGDGDPVVGLEHVIATHVAPLAREVPTLLLVLDGLSGRVANELLDEVVERADAWGEFLLPGHSRRAAALSVLPSTTEVSRASLLAGRVVSQKGSSATEKRDFPALARSLRLGEAPIFHKADLDQVPPGAHLAHRVDDAVRDVGATPLVACVLNTIDDALHHADPGGMVWNSQSIRHLRPLLNAAANAGRAVVITSDHGHIVHRHESRLEHSTRRARGGVGDQRVGGPRVRQDVGECGLGEMRAEGARVVGAPLVLAVDELLRYGQAAAGYHGGAAPAEVVVPVIVLYPGTKLNEGVYRPAPSQRPVWWSMASTVLPAGPDVQEAPASLVPTLFDVPEHDADEASAQGAAVSARARRVVESDVYANQVELAGRFTLDANGMAALIDRLLAAPGTRLPQAPAAQALGIPTARWSGAFAQVQKVLNVEGYPVVRDDAGSIVLDADLLAEQFEVTL